MESKEELQAAMDAIEAQEASAEISVELRQAALAGLGSKFLAVGSPATLGLVDVGPAAGLLQACHEHMFGPLEVRCAGAPYSAEEALACDIVCLPSTAEFSLDWIADATHLNVVDQGPWSEGMKALARSASMTLVGPPRHRVERPHGGLNDVIQGSVSGRMGEEVTVLLWTP
jgi:hypothetical protein